MPLYAGADPLLSERDIQTDSGENRSLRRAASRGFYECGTGRRQAQHEGAEEKGVEGTGTAEGAL